jgi:hypothetical protein
VVAEIFFSCNKQVSRKLSTWLEGLREYDIAWKETKIHFPM